MLDFPVTIIRGLFLLPVWRLRWPDIPLSLHHFFSPQLNFKYIIQECVSLCKYLHINILLDIFVYILIMGFEIKERRKFERGQAQRGFTFDRREAS